MANLARRDEGSSLPARDPVFELNRLVREMDSILDRAFASLGQPGVSRLWDAAFTPLADIEETEDAYVIEIELPGIAREDASVEVQGRRVIVTGERKERERKGIFRTKSRITGRFHYEAALPGDIDADGVTASYDSGLLIIRAPKPASERSKVRKIQVQ
jgi:HSP20 family protein